MRRRPNFSVAAWVVVLVMVVMFGVSLVRPLVPAPPPNPIANYAGDYLKQAASENIEWHPADATAFSEARRLDRPVLIFIGMAWSQTAREFDTDVLSSADVQNYLSTNFVCVRIDGSEAPAWVSAYLPISRITIGIRPRFQIWALEPDGKLFGNVARRLATSKLSSSNFLNELEKLHTTYTQLRQTNATADMETQQKGDLTQIESQDTITIDYAGVLATVNEVADTRNGGFPINGYQDIRPYAWQFLGEMAQSQLLHNTLMPALRSPAVDVLDGGFFQAARSEDRSSIEFDKSAITNAETAAALALALPTLSDPQDKDLCKYVLRQTVNSLNTEFRADSGFVCAARIGDEQETGRSWRTSITPQRLREALDPDDREWARKHLGLRVESNPIMVAFLASSEALEKVDTIRVKLLANARPSTFSNGSFMDVNGTVAARMMQTGRALQDDGMVNAGSNLFSKIDEARVGDTVPHDLEVPGRSQATLLDFLAYADAALQDYLSSGRVPSLENGLAVLQRGLTIYAGAVPGEFNVGLRPSSDLLPSAIATPQVIDDLGESASAKVVRLCTSYGRLFLGSGERDQTGLFLMRTAYATEGLLAQEVNALGIYAASFACAALDLDSDRYAIAVGPDALSLANQLYALRPTRFIASASGPARTDLAAKTPGIYILQNGVPTGPLTVAQAASALSYSFKATK